MSTPTFFRRDLPPRVWHRHLVCPRRETHYGLITELIRRCFDSECPNSEPDTCVALPIQKHAPEMAGTRILDLAVFLVLLPAHHKRPILGDRILEIAETSPTACKHLFPFVSSICHTRVLRNPALRLLGHIEDFGVTFPPHETVMSRWHSSELSEDLEICERLKR
ncbi:hypothetical protein DFH09DRAFT_273631 [Mycena vulgaris]|nr:hypothetical protein DFH09DRAFT_298273 [Mycena vulgaris]KAJ6509659.1 hypothetical protein DFH09DRAFT_273631 [Mycena vulgaris]